MPTTQAHANNHTGIQRNRLRRAAAGIAVGLSAAGLIALAARGPSSSIVGAIPSCAPRVIVVDGSSSDRSNHLSELAYQLIDSAATSAALCATPFTAIAVTGGGTETPIITSDDVSTLTPIGPTLQIRRLRFGAQQRAAVDRLVRNHLRAAYRVGNPKLTSIAALYDAASQHVASGTRVVFVTDGVNNDAQVNLNRPLGVGQGASLAGAIQVAPLRGASVTLVGIAQVDSSSSPPSPTWAEEIQAFSDAVCHDSQAMKCRIFDTASVTQALDS